MKDDSLIFSPDEITRWNICVDRYLVSSHNDKEACQDIFDAYIKSITEILLEISEKVAPSDKWTFHRMGNTLIVRSHKLEHDFEIGICFEMRFYIETELVYPQNIAYMTDEFWTNVIELNQFGQLQYLKNRIFDIPESINHKALKRKNSNILSMAHNYILFMAQELEGMNEYEDTCSCDYGTLEVSWPIDIGFENLLRNYYMVFKRFYKINYLLYRQQYIADRNK